MKPVPLWLRACSRLPFGLLYALATALCFLLRYVLRYRVRVARANLRGCFPELPPERIEAILNSYYRSLGQIVAECIKLATMSSDELRRRVQLPNLELLARELAAGRSVILLAAHLGNWEWQLQGTTVRSDVPIDAAYKPLHSAGADELLLRVRSRLGARMVPAKKLVRVVARARGQLHIVALMADQIPASSAGRHWVSFFGRPTAFYPGPAEIARMTGYVAMFAGMQRTSRGHYEISFEPLARAGEVLAPEAFTARYAQLLEAEIRRDPANWIWTHRRWKLAPPQAQS
ncbi:MAG TPA: lysophospholipid acyltransferase family protein [Steroidobacteraceae bacterium]|jgi:KDO2-lipid IV(A) lauroyltransferase